MENEIFKDLYVIFLDGEMIGITHEEDCIWDIAQNELNGIDVLCDDDVDRVSYNLISTNRYYQDGKSIVDKISNESILCYDYIECINGIEQLNALNLEKEKAEAKIRAITL